MIRRRGFFAGLAASLAAPAIIRFDALMPVRVPTLFVPEPALFAPEYGGGLLTIEDITREAVKFFRDTNAFLRNLNQQYQEPPSFMQIRMCAA